MKILIIRFSSIGDIVLTTPAIRCIKEQVAGAEVHYLTKQRYESVLKGNPYIDRLHLLDRSLSATITSLRGEHFDQVIDLHNNLRTRLIKLRLGVPSRSFNKLNIEKWLLVKLKINRLPAMHIAERYLQTAKHLGVTDDGQGLDHFLTGEYNIGELLPPSHQRFIGFVIGAQHFTKRLPVNSIFEICKAIDTPVVLLGGPEDAGRGREIAERSGPKVFNGCGTFTLDQSAFLVKNASRIITHDTGLMHIAAAFKKPVISVWGNTVPEFGMYPYRTAYSAMVEVKGLECRPCSKIGFSECPRGHFRCMNEIAPADVSRLVNNYAAVDPEI